MKSFLKLSLFIVLFLSPFLLTAGFCFLDTKYSYTTYEYASPTCSYNYLIFETEGSGHYQISTPMPKDPCIYKIKIDRTWSGWIKKYKIVDVIYFGKDK
jgi:hypothetical protein